MKQKRLYRSEKNKMVAGVCAGLAEYLDVDPTIVRIIFLAGFIFGVSASFWIYLVMWLVVPTESQSNNAGVVQGNVDEMKQQAEKVVANVKEAFAPKKEDSDKQE